jgi:AhpD family alkylhydroperoxidase
MARLNVVTPALANGQTKELYEVIKRAVGAVPNIYQGVGNSAAALEGVLHIGEVLKKAQLSAAEIEAIKLAVSQAYGCNYCLAAHSLLGKKKRGSPTKKSSASAAERRRSPRSVRW